MNMSDTLVSFETAKLAKEKGFPDILGLTYSQDGRLEGHRSINYPAPTQSLLQKWLREEHNISVNPIPNFKTKVNQYHIGIVFINKGVVDSTIMRIDDVYKTIVLFDSYEEALEKGLQEALKLIK